MNGEVSATLDGQGKLVLMVAAAFAFTMTMSMAVTTAAAFAFAMTMTVTMSMTTAAAFAFTVTMSVATAATFSVFMIAISTASAAATFAAQHLDELLEFFIGGVAHGGHLTLEVERLASQGMVEVDHHSRVFYFEHQTVETVAVGVHQGENGTRVNGLLVEFAVDVEGLLREFEHVLLLIWSVSFLYAQREVEFIAFVEGGNVLLESIEGYAHAGDEVEGMFGSGLFHEFVDAFGVVGVEFVCHVDILVGSLFHNI